MPADRALTRQLQVRILRGRELERIALLPFLPLILHDLHSLVNSFPEGSSPVVHSTVFGGLCTVLAVAAIAVVASLLILSYVDQTSVASQPVAVPITLSYALLQSAAATSGASVSGISTTRPLTSGLRISVYAHGPLCGTLIDWNATNLLQLENSFLGFNYTSSYDNSSWASVHTFDCPSCALLTTSSLDAYFDVSCQVSLLLPVSLRYAEGS